MEFITQNRSGDGNVDLGENTEYLLREKNEVSGFNIAEEEEVRYL